MALPLHFNTNDEKQNDDDYFVPVYNSIKLSVTSTQVNDSNDFEFECRVCKTPFKLIAKMTLSNAIISGRFVQKKQQNNDNNGENDGGNDENYGGNDDTNGGYNDKTDGDDGKTDDGNHDNNGGNNGSYNDKNNGKNAIDESIPISFFMKLMGQCVKKLIMNNQYHILSPFSDKNGVSILFTHPFLNTYVLKIDSAQFREELMDDLNEEATTILVKELFNKCQLLEKQIKQNRNQVFLFSRREFIKSKYYEKSPFDVRWNEKELFGDSCSLREVPQVIEDDAKTSGRSIHSLYEITRLNAEQYPDYARKSGISQLLMINEMVVHKSVNRVHEFVAIHPNSLNPFKFQLPELRCDLRIERSTYHEWCLRGSILIKPSAFQPEQINGADSITLESFNKFVFDKNAHVIGILDMNDEWSLPILKSKFFVVRYTRTGPSGTYSHTYHTHHYYAVYMVQLKQKILSLKMIQAFQGSNDGSSSMTPSGFTNGGEEILPFSSWVHCTVYLSAKPNAKMELSFNLPLFPQ